jgi:hypothetical protein
MSELDRLASVSGQGRTCTSKSRVVEGEENARAEGSSSAAVARNV